MANYSIPYAFEMYGRLDIEADSLEEAYEKAEDELVNISEADMLQNASFLEDSLEVDWDGNVLKDDQLIDTEEMEL